MPFLFIFKTSFKYAIYFSSLFISGLSLNWSFEITYVLICFALYRNFKVFRDSSKQNDLVVIVAIITVKVLPPNESCKSLVNFDYLNGGLFLSLKHDITFPSVVKDKFMFFNSSKC